MENNHPLSELMRTTLDSVRAMADANTIVGAPIQADGVTLIPVSKLSFGVAGGGTEFTTKKQPAGDNSFGGGSGASAKLEPVAFLVVREGGVKLLPVLYQGPAGPQGQGGGPGRLKLPAIEEPPPRHTNHIWIAPNFLDIPPRRGMGNQRISRELDRKGCERVEAICVCRGGPFAAVDRGTPGGGGGLLRYICRGDGGGDRAGAV